MDVIFESAYTGQYYAIYSTRINGLVGCCHHESIPDVLDNDGATHRRFIPISDAEMESYEDWGEAEEEDPVYRSILARPKFKAQYHLKLVEE